MTTLFKPADCNSVPCFGGEVWKEVIRRWVELDFSEENWMGADQGVCNERVRQLGHQIYESAGSTELLLRVAENVRQRLEKIDSALERCFMSDINVAWNGIGNWQA